MNKNILFICLLLLGLPTMADYTVQTIQPVYPAQTINYPIAQQSYNQQYAQYPYPTQSPSQYVNPYMYPRYSYGYGNNLPYPVVNSALFGVGSTGSQQVMKNIGQNILFRILRGY